MTSNQQTNKPTDLLNMLMFQPGYGSKFRACATAIEKAFPDVEVLGNSKGRPRAGAFEVTSEDGTVFWSKLGTANYMPFPLGSPLPILALTLLPYATRLQAGLASLTPLS